ncbi:hypothetical protein Hanom_Chr11g01015241 [Helianthus anomalus]
MIFNLISQSPKMSKNFNSPFTRWTLCPIHKPATPTSSNAAEKLPSRVCRGPRCLHDCWRTTVSAYDHCFDTR